MTLSARDRRTMAGGAAALAVILVLRFAAIPWIGDWAGARQRIAAARRQLDDLQRKVRRALPQRDRLARIYGPGANKPLQDLEPARARLYEAVQHLLKTSGFKPKDYQAQPPRRLADLPGVDFVPLQVKGTCRLPQLAQCLSRMREADTLVIIDRVSVTNNDKSPGKLEVTLVLATLAQRRKAQP